jgi:hypothetical protein
MGLNISCTDIKLDFERTPSALDIRTQNARLDLHQKHAKINLRTEKPKVLIDQYECFAEEGLKNNYDLTKEAAQKGYQQALDFIAKTAEDGKTLAAIEHGGNPVADIAKRDSFPEHELILNTIPRSRPRITVEGDLKIEPERNWEGINNGVEGNFTPGSVNIDYQPAKVNINVTQYPAVDIRYTKNRIDTLI